MKEFYTKHRFYAVAVELALLNLMYPRLGFLGSYIASYDASYHHKVLNVFCTTICIAKVSFNTAQRSELCNFHQVIQFWCIPRNITLFFFITSILMEKIFIKEWELCWSIECFMKITSFKKLFRPSLPMHFRSKQENFWFIQYFNEKFLCAYFFLFC